MYLPPIPVCCDLQRLGFQFLLERNFLQFIVKELGNVLYPLEMPESLCIVR